MCFKIGFEEGEGRTFQIFIYRILYHRALEKNIKFSIVCCYLRKMIRQFSGVYYIVTMDVIYFSKGGIENR